MTREGIDTESICLHCKSKGVEPVVTSALHQTCGNPMRAVRFFCCKCCSVHDRVDLGEMPPCPVPWKVWQSMRKIPHNAAPFLCREIDFETMEAISNKLPRGKSCGADCIPREYCKDGTALLREYRAAFNAFIRCQQPTTHVQEWMAEIVTFVPKILCALENTDNRPIASLCVKLMMIFLKILCKNLYKVMEDYKLVDDAQEGFRWFQSTKRQLSKIICNLEEQRRRKTVLCSSSGISRMPSKLQIINLSSSSMRPCQRSSSCRH